MSSKPIKLRVTQTLLSSWLYVFKKDNGYEEFLDTLNKKPTPQNKAMLDGIRFEGLVNNCMDGVSVPDDIDIKEQVEVFADYLKGSAKQVTVFRDIDVDGQIVTLHGVLDFLRAGKIFDTKFSKTYSVGKYFKSPQHPMYFALVPEATEFEYVVCNGKHMFRETYHRCDIYEPIEDTIRHFYAWLKQHNLWEVYCEKWKIKD